MIHAIDVLPPATAIASPWETVAVAWNGIAHDTVECNAPTKMTGTAHEARIPRIVAPSTDARIAKWVAESLQGPPLRHQCSENFTGIATHTAMGLPFARAGSNRLWTTAATAASSSPGIEATTRVS